MKTLSRLWLGLLLVMALAVPATAQTLINNTTLSAAITSLSATTISLTATTCTNCTFGPGTLIFVDNEAMRVTGAYTSGTTNIPVQRGSDGTQAGLHANAAVVFLGPGARFKNATGSGENGNPPQLACVRSQQPFLPWINISNGWVWTCDSSVWRATVLTGVTYSSRTTS